MEIFLIVAMMVTLSCAHKKTNTDSGKEKVEIVFETMDGIIHPMCEMGHDDHLDPLYEFDDL